MIGDVEDEKDTLTAPVVRAGDGPETFLSGSVPDLELDVLSVNEHSLEAEVDSDGRQVVFRELFLDKTYQDG